MLAKRLHGRVWCIVRMLEQTRASAHVLYMFECRSKTLSLPAPLCEYGRYDQFSQAMGLLRFHRHSKSEAPRTRETAVFYLADPIDVGFLDVFFPTAGSREASFPGAWMAS